MVKQYESDALKKDQMIAIEGSHRQDAILELSPGQRSKTGRAVHDGREIEGGRLLEIDS